MTPRQIIQQISERRHLQSITAEKVYLEEEKYYNVCGNTSESVNKNEFEVNNKIKQCKRKESLPQRTKSKEHSTPRTNITYTVNMYPTQGDYLQGNAILTKSREVDSPTRFYDCPKERERKTSNVSFTTLYSTFKNVSEGTRRADNRKIDAVLPKPKAKRVERNDSWSENGYFDSGMSNIRGMAKKIHDKSFVMKNIIAENETDRLKSANEKLAAKTKRLEEQRQKVKDNEIKKRGMSVGKDSTKQIRLHIYVPTAEMNS